MPKDAPRLREDDVPCASEPASPDDDPVDVLAIEEEILVAEAESGFQQEDVVFDLEEEDPLERANRLCREAQRGAIDRRFLVANEIPPGHTLERHVGKTDDWLRERLAGEHRKTASTFTDLETAERAIARVLRTNSAAIDEWLAAGTGDDLRLELEHDAVAGRVIASTGATTESRLVRVMLCQTERGYRIRTAYLL